MFFRKHGRIKLWRWNFQILRGYRTIAALKTWTIRGGVRKWQHVLSWQWCTTPLWVGKEQWTQLSNRICEMHKHTAACLSHSPVTAALTTDVKSKHPVKIRKYIYVWERLSAWESNMQHMQFHYRILHHSWRHYPSWTLKNSHTGSMQRWNDTSVVTRWTRFHEAWEKCCHFRLY